LGVPLRVTLRAFILPGHASGVSTTLVDPAAVFCPVLDGNPAPAISTIAFPVAVLTPILISLSDN
jgi:hypothetical protein